MKALFKYYPTVNNGPNYDDPHYVEFKGTGHEITAQYREFIYTKDVTKYSSLNFVELFD